MRQIICYGLHRHKISTQLYTYWTDVLSPNIKIPTEVIFWKNDVHFYIQFQTHLQILPNVTEVVLVARGGPTPY